MFDFLQPLFSTEGFMPHGHCYLWTPALVYINVISDSMIFAAYTAIGLSLLFLVLKVKEIPFQSVQLAFGLFIVACGVGHFMEIINVWTPTYWLTGSVKIVTAIASIGTAVALPFFFPKIRDLAKGAVLLKTQNALRESEMLYRQIVDTANEGIWLLDLEGKTKFVNQRMATMLATQPEAMMGLPLTDFIDEEGQQAYIKHVSQKTDAAEGLELAMYPAVGDRVYVRVLCNDIHDKDGKVIGALGMVTDVTKKREAEIAQREAHRIIVESQLKLKAALHNMDAFLWSVDRNLILTTAEGTYPSYPSDPFRNSQLQVGRSMLEFFPEYSDRVQAIYKAKEGQSIVYERQIGASFRENRINPLKNQSGEIVGVVGVSVDITERKRAAVREEAAVEASRLKSEFLANMSHEIRTPLNGVLGMNALLAETELTPEQADLVENAKSSGEALLTVLNDILDFSKIEAGKIDFESVDFNIRSLLVNAQKMVSYAAREKSLGIHTEVADDFPEFVKGDPGRLRQILWNLLSNAIKFTDVGTVTLRAERLPSEDTFEHLRFEIEDSGIGISSEAQKQLFNAFSQADSSTTRLYGGTGLGLSIAKNLVQRMQGEIGLSSIEGSGSKFWFTVILGQGQVTHEIHADEQMLTSHPNAKILVADDNVINRMVVLQFLKFMGYQAEAVANGREVMKSLQVDKYDLILMDCHMPELDGYDCTALIRKSFGLYRDIPIIALTASVMRRDYDRCLSVGMNGFVAKPIRKTNLFEAVEAQLERTHSDKKGRDFAKPNKVDSLES